MKCRLIARARAFLVNERAAASAEFAMVVPVFLLLVFGIINGSIMYSAQTQMHYAAQRTARCLAVDVGTDCDDADAFAKDMYNGPSLSGLTFASEDDPICGWKVTGTGEYQLVSGINVTTVNISAESCYPKI